MSDQDKIKALLSACKIALPILHRGKDPLNRPSNREINIAIDAIKLAVDECKEKGGTP